MADDLADLEAKAATAERFSRHDAERMLATSDLVSVGSIGDGARKRRSGDTITFGRVCEIRAGGPVTAESVGEAGEVRLAGVPLSVDDAVSRVRHAQGVIGERALTGFSAADLFELCGRDATSLSACAEALRAGGLEAVAECPVDAFESVGQLIDVMRALAEGGVGAWRLTVTRAPLGRRLDIAERAAAVQDATGAVRAFAPLPRQDQTDQPSTGYDDVRTVAITRVVCREIPAIQVDWPLYGPKLAQVALLYGANDVDGILPVDTAGLGPRRSPLEDIRRQIRDAAGIPVERNGRYEPLS
jgi:aminodeoxyfutalosine synthase